jgi:hypothetical protein
MTKWANPRQDLRQGAEPAAGSRWTFQWQALCPDDARATSYPPEEKPLAFDALALHATLSPGAPLRINARILAVTASDVPE